MVRNIKPYGIVFFLLLAGGVVFMMLTNPEELPIYLLIVPFLWLFSILYMVVFTLLRRRNRGNQKKIFLLASIMAALPTLMLLLQSIRQLSPRDAVLLICFCGLCAIYVWRADFIK